MKVSIILPAYNSEKTIKKCITSLLKMKEADEIIIINDASTDNTEKIIKSIKRKKIKYYSNPKNIGTSKTKNKGAKKAKNPIIFFAEADAYYDKNYLKHSLKHFNNPKVFGTIGKGLNFNKKNIITDLRLLEKKIGQKNYKPISAWVMRKKIFDKEKGYDEKLICGEDVDLGRRIKKAGYKIIYEPKAKWHHKEPETIKQLIKRNIWQGRHEDDLHDKYKEKPAGRIIDILLLISITCLFFKKELPLLLTIILYLGSKYKKIFKALRTNAWLGIIFPIYLLLKRFSVFIGVLQRYWFKLFTNK